MPIQKTDRNDTWFVNSADQTWTLSKNARITVNNTDGIYETAMNSTIKVLGDIKVTGGTGDGVYLNSTDAVLNIGLESNINAKQGENGIYSGASGAEIVNRGIVDGNDAGIGGAIWSNIRNYGTIRGEDGISHMNSGSQIYNYGTIDGTRYGITEMAGGNYIENGKKGEISGDATAILLEGSGEAEIVNHGVLRGGIAIGTAGDTQTVTNTGEIFGDIYLGAGADIFDSRKGSVKGEVHGGDNDDDYYVGKAGIKIVEDDMGGYDEVFATATHKLAANIEALRLQGKQDINGTGNAGTNWLYGNAGDNELNGGGGTDYLFGQGGNDTLKGGGGIDYFVFNRDGVDRITDFQDGMDQLIIDGIDSQSDFNALDIKQTKQGDLVIDFGGGDRIIIEDMLKTDFTYAEDVSLP